MFGSFALKKAVETDFPALLQAAEFVTFAQKLVVGLELPDQNIDGWQGDVLKNHFLGVIFTDYFFYTLCTI